MEKVHTNIQVPLREISEGPAVCHLLHRGWCGPFLMLSPQASAHLFTKLLLFQLLSIVVESALPCLERCLIPHFSGVLSQTQEPGMASENM